ncbi:hypothetical protein, partial [Streptomyces californicus]|uniref:hypothetical protein n=1 Tax=Streptomyces californicus TaxID=67351 RepID=UPI00296EACB6
PYWPAYVFPPVVIDVICDWSGHRIILGDGLPHRQRLKCCPPTGGSLYRTRRWQAGRGAAGRPSPVR